MITPREYSYFENVDHEPEPNFFFKEKTVVETSKTILSRNYRNVGFPGYLTSMEKKRRKRVGLGTLLE